MFLSCTLSSSFIADQAAVEQALHFLKDSDVNLGNVDSCAVNWINQIPQRQAHCLMQSRCFLWILKNIKASLYILTTHLLLMNISSKKHKCKHQIQSYYKHLANYLVYVWGIANCKTRWKGIFKRLPLLHLISMIWAAKFWSNRPLQQPATWRFNRNLHIIICSTTLHSLGATKQVSPAGQTKKIIHLFLNTTFSINLDHLDVQWLNHSVKEVQMCCRITEWSKWQDMIPHCFMF